MLLLATATHALAQAPVTAPEGVAPARKSSQPAASTSSFTIDQKGAKRTTGTASGFTIDQKGAKRTGDPLPDVDVSLDRKNQRVKAPVTGTFSPSSESASKPSKAAAPK